MFIRRSLFCLLFVYGFASADELADANALLQQKSYPQALKSYTKLANAGNVEAQQHLGEMYWYGEAGTVDEAVAAGWFRKAMRQRVARKEEINYWLSKYDGADLKSGQYRCAAPRLPPVSKENAEIDAVAARIENWQNCYNGFVANLNNSSPLAKRIPADISALMKEDELEKAKVYLAEVQTRLIEDARISSKLVLADVDAWRSATNAYVNEHNAIIKAGPSAERQADIEARKRNYAPAK
jgi:TPR repeat protein